MRSHHMAPPIPANPGDLRHRSTRIVNGADYRSRSRCNCCAGTTVRSPMIIYPITLTLACYGPYFSMMSMVR